MKNISINLDSEIMTKLSTLNGSQKSDVLNYVESMKTLHSHRVYRKRAMKQIREALETV